MQATNKNHAMSSEDRSSTFLRNASKLLPENTMSHPRRNYCIDILISNKILLSVFVSDDVIGRFVVSMQE
jgi:hypothetical protein